MATQPPGNDCLDGLSTADTTTPSTPQNPQTPVPAQRRHAPSLDVMAGQPAAGAASTRPPIVTSVEDSRSSSSTNSPVPYDNAAESDFFMGGNDSESSLGVPNIQDVDLNGINSDDEDNTSGAESDHCFVAPVNRLPNEILIGIFSRLSSHGDLLSCVLTCKRWARNSVDLLWHRPACTDWTRHKSVCQTLTVSNTYFPYREFIKRLNLATIASQVSDGSVVALAACNRIERLTLTNCKNLTDTGLMALVQNSTHLLALDVSYANQITMATVNVLAQYCKRLQGLNITSCTKISNEGLINLAQNCKYIKRIKLNECTQVTDETVFALAKYCPNMLEIDLQNCNLVTNAPITKLLSKGQALRELRLTGCELITDDAFLDLPDDRIYEQLRILDVTSCVNLTDLAVDRIIKVAPRLRNLVLAKCRNITDASVHSISRLGKNLHYLHLGHCVNITDEAVKRLVYCCNRIRYIDLGCCTNLTDDSVTRLASLPKLKRIGLVKCNNITDESVFALARANLRRGQRREHYGPSAAHVDGDGNVVVESTAAASGAGAGASASASAGMSSSSGNSSLERVHLSYCSQLTIRSIIRLLNACNRLTHLSLTGVPAFLREDLARFCRSPPPEFTAHQREMFCVFSGDGVSKLRIRLNENRQYDMYRDQPTATFNPAVPPMPSLLDVLNGGLPNVMPNGNLVLPFFQQPHPQHGPAAAGTHGLFGLPGQAGLPHGGLPGQTGGADGFGSDGAGGQMPTPANHYPFHQQTLQRSEQGGLVISPELLRHLPRSNATANEQDEDRVVFNFSPEGTTVPNGFVVGDNGSVLGEGTGGSDMLVDATMGSMVSANSNSSNANNQVPPPPPPAPRAPYGLQAPLEPLGTPPVRTQTSSSADGLPGSFGSAWRATVAGPSIADGPRSTPLSLPFVQPSQASSASTASTAPIGPPPSYQQSQAATGASAASLSVAPASAAPDEDL